MSDELFICTRCQKAKPGSDFYYKIYRLGERTKQCRACIASLAKIRKIERKAQYAPAHKAWRQKHKEKLKESAKAWRSKNYSRMRLVQVTNTRVRRALAKGLINKSDRCEFCGGGSTGTIEASHEDYRQPFQIRWLCRPCHRKWDTERPKTILSARVLAELCMRRPAPQTPKQLTV